jgi:hypothetical protein
MNFTVFFLVSILTTTFHAYVDNNLPVPYSEINELLPFDDHGWYSNANEIEKLITKYQPKVIVEIGSWMGKSTRHMASIIAPEGKVYAIDHWLGSEEHQPGMSAWHPNLDKLYEQFLSNVIHEELTHKIIPLRMSSLEAAKSLSVDVDLVYIDAAHDFASVYSDLKAWFPFVKNHGILCGDDWY